jgi:hypothetical protein
MPGETPADSLIKNDKNLIDIFWQSGAILKYVEMTDLETFGAVEYEVVRLYADANKEKKPRRIVF